MSGLPKVVPPLRFGIVEVGVYRGAYPTLFNFPFLKTLSLRTIISLIPENPTPDLEDFCTVEGVRLLHYMVEKRKDDVTVSMKDMSEIVSIMIQPARLPVYLHCLDGSEATGLVICCLRRLQAWDSECSTNEFCRYSRTGEMLTTEAKFVQSFKEIEIPEGEPPAWLWQGKLPEERHPFIKLTHRHQGRVIQVVKVAEKEARRKEKQAVGLMGALAPRTNKPFPPFRKPGAEQEVWEGAAGGGRRSQGQGSSNRTATAARQSFLGTRDDGDAWEDSQFTAGSATDFTDMDSSNMIEGSEEEEEHEEEVGDREVLSGFPSLIEALSLHNFSDLTK